MDDGGYQSTGDSAMASYMVLWCATPIWWIVNCFQEPFDAYIMRLNEYVQAHPESMTEPVETTLRHVACPPFAKPVQRPSVPNETPKELAAKWGAHNDGDEWRGATTWNLWVCLQCYSSTQNPSKGLFPKRLVAAKMLPSLTVLKRAATPARADVLTQPSLCHPSCFRLLAARGVPLKSLLITTWLLRRTDFFSPLTSYPVKSGQG